MTLPVLQITPRFLPQIDGLGDYARLLAEHLRDSFGISSRFLVGDPQWSQLEKIGATPFQVEAVAARNADELFRRLQKTETVILHYVTYGYHPRGVPFWINRALRRWKTGQTGRRLIVVFHEVWASGPPWKSEFFTSLIQRRLVVELHRLADGVLTSTALMEGMLNKIQPGKTQLRPIPSAFPPMAAVGDRTFHRAGPIRVVAFGQEASRLLSIEVHEKLLRALHAAGLLSGVEVVGKGADDGATPSSDIQRLRSFLPAALVRAYRDVSPARGADLLQNADLFLSYYPSILACKSSALTAALAAGCVPVLPEARSPEPLREGSEILACDGSEAQIAAAVAVIRAGKLGAMGEAGWQWYGQNASWNAVTSAVADMLVRH